MIIKLRIYKIYLNFYKSTAELNRQKIFRLNYKKKDIKMGLCSNPEHKNLPLIVLCLT